MTASTSTSPPTVLIFRKRLLPWSETFIAAQARALRRYHPILFGFRGDRGGIGYLDGSEVMLLSNVRPLPALRRAICKLTGQIPRKFRRRLDQTPPNLVHAHFGTSIGIACRIARSLDVPLVVTFHGRDVTAVLPSTAAAERRAVELRRVDRAIAVSEFIAQQLRDAGCPPDRITVHRIGVDTDRFSPPAHAVDSKRILFVGRLVPKKGLAHLIRAFPHVIARVPDASLVVVGDGPLRTELEQLARELNVNVTFAGVQTPDRIAYHMRNAALLAAPSIVAPDGDAEGLPMTVMEALASALPVVASPSGGTAEGVRDGETGFIVPSGNETLLAARIGDVLADTALRARMSLAARQFALESFSLARQTAALETIYDDVCRQFNARRTDITPPPADVD